jgi:hypothetical protein
MDLILDQDLVAQILARYNFWIFKMGEKCNTTFSIFDAEGEF